jgi:hypothetical protein
MYIIGNNHIEFIHQYQQQLEAPQKRLVLHDVSPTKKILDRLKPTTSTPKKGRAKRVVLGKRGRGGSLAGPAC